MRASLIYGGKLSNSRNGMPAKRAHAVKHRSTRGNCYDCHHPRALVRSDFPICRACKRKRALKQLVALPTAV